MAGNYKMTDEDQHEDPTRGRPSKYKPEFAKLAGRMCNLGATDADLADFFEVSIRTVERWRSEHDDFCRAIKDAKNVADSRVERSLYQRALGYSHDAVKIMTVNGDVVCEPYREHYPPDTTAAIFWLKNRKPDKWREKQAVELSGVDGKPIEVTKIERVIVRASEDTDS